MERSKWVALFTGVVSLLLGVGYLVLVQLLDWRGDMIPAPIEAGFVFFGKDKLSLGFQFFL